MSGRPRDKAVCMGLLAGFLLLGQAARGWAADEPTTLERVQKIALHGRAGQKLEHVILDGKHHRLLLSNMANRSLDLIDVKAGKLHREVADQRGIQGVAFAPDLDRIFVGIGVGGACNVFEGDSGKAVKSIKLTDEADNVRYDRRSGKVYVAHAPNALAVIDGKTLKLEHDLGMPGFVEGFQVEKERPRLYGNVPALREVVVLDTSNHQVLHRYPVRLAAGNYSMGVDEKNHRLFLGCRKGPLLVVMDSETGKEVTSAPLAGDVDDVLFDAKRKRIYASCGEGQLVVLHQISADRYEELERIRTAKLARTACLDPETGRVYLAVPRQEGSAGPEIWVYKPKP